MIQKSVKDLSNDEKEFMFQLIKENMMNIYQTGLDGWRSEDVKKELEIEDGRFIIIDGGFAQYQFSTDPVYDCFEGMADSNSERQIPCIYIYQLQISVAKQQQGLGSILLQKITEIAEKSRTSWIKLTCFKCNSSAKRFYSKSGFVLDSSDAVFHLDPEDAAAIPYSILSKEIQC
jgi:ribosomal protein S18 acetylase RimI-like enzyme